MSMLGKAGTPFITTRISGHGSPVSRRVRGDDGGDYFAQTEKAEMTDKATAKLKAFGWTTVETSGFISLVAPLWQRVVNGEYEYALAAQDKHHNLRCPVQDGVLMTL